MSIASPTTTMNNNNSSPSSNPLTSLLHSITKKRSVSPVVQRFVGLCVKNTDMTSQSTNINEHTEKMIRHLVKKLTKLKKNGAIEELERAILHKDSRTKCVTIPRSLDNPPNQSSKSNPVVIYSRFWRWPDLSNQNELKPVDYCQNAFQYGKDDICVNPFHYERVPAKYSVYVPHLPPEAFRDMPDLRSASMNDIMPNQIPENTTYQSTIEQQQSPPSYQLSPGSISSQDSLLSPPGATTNDENNHQSHETPMDFDIPLPAPSNSNPPFGQHLQQQSISTISPHPSQYSITNGEQVPFDEPHEWCLISYYEMSTRVGEQFHATQPQVIIDGFTDPSNAERFCLGGLTNVHRTFEIDKARRHIGRGVKLFHIRGNVFAECISDNPVFVQSPIANQRLSWHPATVCKIPPKVRLKIFDSDDFTQILSTAVHEGYEAVYNLMRMCIIRMSFVKGWGVEYRRQAVTCTPCWVEIHLEGPLKWLDTVLSTMRGPTQSITSVS